MKTADLNYACRPDRNWYKLILGMFLIFYLFVLMCLLLISARVRFKLKPLWLSNLIKLYAWLLWILEWIVTEPLATVLWLKADLSCVAFVLSGFVLTAFVVDGAGLCLCPQRSGSCSGTLRETAALQPSQVQLFPLRAGLIRQTGSAGGNRENHLRWLCGEGKSELVHFTKQYFFHHMRGYDKIFKK